MKLQVVGNRYAQPLWFVAANTQQIASLLFVGRDMGRSGFEPGTCFEGCYRIL